MQDDEMVYSIKGSLKAIGKNKVYRQKVINFWTTLLNFFEENGLLKNIQILDEDGHLKQDLIIRDSNLTDDGLKMVEGGADVKWENYLNRSTAENKLQNTSILVKELKKIREEKANNS